MSKIKFLVMDVDGTLTDGKIYMGQGGEIAKAFDIKDGCGIFLVLPKLDIVPVIITARESKIVENRCKELNIHELFQGSKDKLSTLNELIKKYDADLKSVAYAGDDLPDIPCMEAIKKSGGVVLCPADAIPEAKALSDYISNYKAGEGAIRDCIHYLAQISEENNIKNRIEGVVSSLLSGEYADQTEGTLSDGTPYTIQEYYTKDESNCVLESHRNHIDIQYIICGSEQFKTYSTYGLTGGDDYDADQDVEYWSAGVETTKSILVKGSIIVLMNNIPHRGGIVNVTTEMVKKVVCKIDIHKK